jgi:hypothetical protein
MKNRVSLIALLLLLTAAFAIWLGGPWPDAPVQGGIAPTAQIPPANSVDVQAARMLRDPADRPKNGDGYLSVLVRDEAGEPVSAAEVRAWTRSADPDDEVSVSQTDVQGRATIALRSDDANLCIVHPNYIEHFQEIDVVGANLLHVTLRSGRWLSGEVKMITGEPVSGAQIRLIPIDVQPDADLRPIAAVKTTSTDNHGRFTIRGRDGSCYALEVLADGRVMEGRGMMKIIGPTTKTAFIKMRYVVAAKYTFVDDASGLRVLPQWGWVQDVHPVSAIILDQQGQTWQSPSKLTPRDFATFQNHGSTVSLWQVASPTLVSIEANFDAHTTINGLHYLISMRRLDALSSEGPAVLRVRPREGEVAARIRFSQNDGKALRLVGSLEIEGRFFATPALADPYIVYMPLGKHRVRLHLDGYSARDCGSVSITGDFGEHNVSIPEGGDVRFVVRDSSGRIAPRFRIVSLRGPGVRLDHVDMRGDLDCVIRGYPTGEYAIVLRRNESGRQWAGAFRVEPGREVELKVVL